MSTGKEIFSEKWCSNFISKWNESTYFNELGGLGFVVFVLIAEESTKQILLFWDEQGKVKKVDQKENSFIKFCATEQDWNSFMDGEFRASEGVLNGRLKFEGALRQITPYSLAFNLISTTVRQMA